MLKRLFFLSFLLGLFSLSAQQSTLSQNETWETGHSAFNGMPEVGKFVANLKKTYNIDTAVETGTYMGSTTVFLSRLFDEVYTIEIVEETYEQSSQKLKNYSNVQCLLGSSETVLINLLPKIKSKPVLFYLDAHWEDHWPLRSELMVISTTHHDNCVIVIDDIKVPGRDDIPYDKYKKNECSFEYMVV